LSRSLVALDQNSTIIAVVELSHSSWLVDGVLPGIECQPRKKLEPSPERLLALLQGWQDEAVRAGRTITRIALAFEAGRDGFWLACGAWRRGSRDPCLACRGIAGISPSENRPARHRVVEARVLGVAVWRTGPL
jgi:transposase